jgi:phosphotriesterase-related protein
MTQVQTVRGPIETADLGSVLMHEHIFVMSAEIMQNYPADWGEEEGRVADAAARLEQLYDHGARSLVDLTVIGLGRFIPRIQRIAERTRLQILVATGIYTYNDVPFYFRFRRMEAMVEMFVRDIEVGIGDTGVRAAILKCATDARGMTRGVEHVLRAVAHAHRQTGVPISTHTHAASRRGLDQQEIFRQEGVDLSRVIIGHCGDTTDIGYLEELIAAGSYLGMDRFGIENILSFDDRVKTVAVLCEHGHADRLLLSHDAACFNDWLIEGDLPQHFPNWNYLHIYKHVLPALWQVGVTGEQIRMMLVENPRRIFEQQGGY